MFRLFTPAIAVCVLAIGVLAHGQDSPDLKAVLKKAITAHGGEKNLTKYAAVTAKFKGTIEVMGKARDIVGENSLQKPTS